MSTADTDVRTLLDREVASLQALPFDSLMERFTEITRGRFSGRTRREERRVGVREVTADSGCTYDAEEWSSIESDDQLHVFVSIMGYDASDQWAEASTDIVIRRGDSPVPSDAG